MKENCTFEQAQMIARAKARFYRKPFSVEPWHKQGFAVIKKECSQDIHSAECFQCEYQGCPLN